MFSRGDEISAVVVDIGSVNARAGYAGEESPKCVVPSHYGTVAASEGGSVAQAMDVDGAPTTAASSSASSSSSASASASASGFVGGGQHRKYVLGTNQLCKWQKGMEVHSPLTRGLVSDWDAYEALVRYCLTSQLSLNPAEHPLLLTEPSFNERTLRERSAELLFEQFDVPALFLCKTAVLSAFSSNRSSALVVDIGGAVSCATPVHEGFALTKSLVRTHVAGNEVSAELLRLLQARGIELNPKYAVTRKETAVDSGQFVTSVNHPAGTTESFRTFHTLELVRDIKETLCKVHEVPFVEGDASLAHQPAVSYELPDGKVVEIGSERLRAPELLFGSAMLPASAATGDAANGLQNLVRVVLSKCDSDHRRDLYGNLILTGGGSLLSNVPDRLQRELHTTLTQKFKLSAAPSREERRFSSWIGGSILASLGSFHQMWMSKAEFEEQGSAFVMRKCP